MVNQKLTIAQLASLTRDMRTAIKLPGVPAPTKQELALAELNHWDCALNILDTLKVEA